ncbi:hypothetical protein GE061_012914 [Apolygus lucorum]|uniref:TTF-type domain-containing protein n=1 Tax=Apolygus lucorum TaxID=248454 RepID=A0A8S9XTP2_APOLU|nr:hypothetical protein GE061_012914 [Apolygus lucorum]
MDHFMVKRRKPNDDEATSDDAGACDSTYQQEDEGGSPREVKVDKYMLDEAMRQYNEQVEKSFRESTGTTPTELPEFPHQPEDVPPYRDRRRPHLFQKKWYKEYPWLHYDVASQSMYCFQCLSAVIRKVADCPPNMQNIFARGGFKNWKKGIERFRVHENSQLHKDTLEFSVKRLFGLKEKCAGVESIISSVNYLVGVGYDTRRSNLLDLLHLRKNDLPELSEHLAKTSFSSADERELLSIMTSSTMRAVSEKIKEAGPYGLVLEKLRLFDKTMFSVTARVSRYTKTDELYLGMYTEQDILHELVNYLDADDLRIYFSDMADSISIAGALDKIQPSALSIHCPNHNICLDLQEVLKKAPGAGRTLMVLDELRKILPKSSYYQDESSDNQIQVCPHRKVLTFKTISAILTNYSDVIVDVKKFLESDSSSYASTNVYNELRKPQTFFSLLLCKVLFYPIENLNGILNKAESVKATLEAVDSVLQILQSSKDEQEFETFWHKYALACKSLELWKDTPNIITTDKSAQKTNYFQTIDTIIDYLKRKFRNEGYDNLLKLESALLKDDDKSVKEADLILKANDINPDSLAMEKRMLTKIMEVKGSFTLPQIVSKFRDLKTGTLGLLPEIMKLVDLLLVAQVAKCGSNPPQRLKNLAQFLNIIRGPDLANEISILYVYKNEPFMNSPGGCEGVHRKRPKAVKRFTQEYGDTGVDLQDTPALLVLPT